MKPGSNGRDGVSRPVERVWEVRRQRFSKLRECGEGWLALQISRLNSTA